MRVVVLRSVEVDICTRCRSLWLDRGELEKVSTWNADAWTATDLPGVGPLPSRSLSRDTPGVYESYGGNLPDSTAADLLEALGGLRSFLGRLFGRH
jgi:hypothetical protein